MKRWTTIPTLLPLTLGALLLAPGCKKDDDDDDDDYGSQITLDETEVLARMDRFAAVIPTCTVADSGSTARRRASPAGLGLALNAFQTVMPQLLAATAAGERRPLAGSGSTGSCGGTLDVTSDHSNGVTAYQLDFASFCMAGETGNVVMTGQVSGTEYGTPSDSGPIIDALELQTDGPLQVDQPGGAMEISVSGLRVDYGKPAAWAPDTPDEAAPDRVRMDKLTVTFPNGEEADQIAAEVEATRVGVLPVVTVEDGIWATDGEGYVRVSTPPDQPIRLPLTDGEVSGLVLSGAEDTVLIARSVAGQPMVASLELNGSPMTVSLDCSATQSFSAEIVSFMVGALPVH